MSSVSRSVYQKLAEENKRLKADIWQMVMRPVTGETILLRMKYKEQFEKDKALANTLHDHAVQYIKDHPDSVAAQIANQFQPKPTSANHCKKCGCSIDLGNDFCGECMCEDDFDPF